jgi:hypothetical protein
MTTAAYCQIIAAPARDRLDLFLATGNRIGAPVGNVEKDSWVCRALNALYHERPAGGPRLLFKGGPSLSKGYDLIKRFSEDIDVTVFRDDLEEPALVEELEALSNKKSAAPNWTRSEMPAVPTSPGRSMSSSPPSWQMSPQGRGAERSMKPIPMGRPSYFGIPK